MKVKTAELIGAALDWAVAICEYKDGRKIIFDYGYVEVQNGPGSLSYFRFEPSTNGARGVPILEREGVSTIKNGLLADIRGRELPLPKWSANLGFGDWPGDTLLVAGLRCHVGTQLGNEVDVPDGLIADAGDGVVLAGTNRTTGGAIGQP